MEIGELRDLIIIILGILEMVGIVVIIVLALVLYRKFRVILDSAQSVAKTAKNISSTVEEEVTRPLAQLATLLRGFQQVLGVVNRFRKNKEEK